MTAPWATLWLATGTWGRGRWVLGCCLKCETRVWLLGALPWLHGTATRFPRNMHISRCEQCQHMAHDDWHKIIRLFMLACFISCVMFIQCMMYVFDDPVKHPPRCASRAMAQVPVHIAPCRVCRSASCRVALPRLFPCGPCHGAPISRAGAPCVVPGGCLPVQAAFTGRKGVLRWGTVGVGNAPACTCGFCTIRLAQ